MSISASIIVPNYNHHKFLEQRIESILNQSFQDFELILLDDCSTDESTIILDKYKDHPKVSVHIYNKVNSGKPILQWEKGIAMANGEFIWIAESDDYSSLEFLKHTVDFLRSHNNSGLVYTQSLDVDSKNEFLQHRIKYTQEFEPNIWENNFVCKGDDFIKSFLKVKNVIPNASAVVFRKSLVKDCFFKSDGITNLKMCADWLFWIKLVENTEIGFLEEPLNFFRNHENSSRNHFEIDKQRQRILEEVCVRNYLEKIIGLYQKDLWIRLFDKLIKICESNITTLFSILIKLESLRLALLFVKVYARKKRSVLRSISGF